ncbi:cob(I)yrinic acid a,c-diamide adenosyltransferase [Desulfatiferula olefinivorans]
MKGYVQIYTGNGKGKTTACLGLTLRAVGAGLTVFILQFLKKGDYSEIKALSLFPDLVTVEQYGLGRFVKGSPSDDDKAAGKQGLARACEIMTAGNVDILILEEACVAVACGLFSESDLLGLIDLKPDPMELVITGRGAGQALIDRADLVTEMKEIKHYYQNGVAARVGIEK